MGAIYDSAVIEASDEKELEQKYHTLVQNKRHMHGHGGYTGTLAEKWELCIIGIPYGRNAWSEEEADSHCSDKNDKWEPAYAYYLGNNKWLVGGWCSS